jgi:hypothetical protein
VTHLAGSTEAASLRLTRYVSAKGRFWGFLMNHLVAAYGGGGVPGTPYRSTVTGCNLLMVCLLDELHAELMFELDPALPAGPISELISIQISLRLAELADVDGVEGCDWSRCELPPVGDARSRDGLSLMASS